MAKAKTGARKAKTDGAENPYPNEARYSDGSVFNLPIQYFADRTKEEIRQKLIDGKNEPEVIEPHLELIEEALNYHGLEFRGVEQVEETAE